MSVIEPTVLRVQGANPRLARVAETLVAKVQTARARRATRKALHALDAHALEDIGLTRADIDRLF